MSVLPLLYNHDNANGGAHRVDHVIAKPPYNEAAFNIRSNGKSLWSQGATMFDQNLPCNLMGVKWGSTIWYWEG